MLTSTSNLDSRNIPQPPLRHQNTRCGVVRQILISLKVPGRFGAGSMEIKPLRSDRWAVQRCSQLINGTNPQTSSTWEMFRIIVDLTSHVKPALQPCPAYVSARNPPQDPAQKNPKAVLFHVFECQADPIS